MKFDLKTPCSQCPFRSDIKPFITGGRAEEIVMAVIHGSTFSCHKTLVEGGGEDEGDEDGLIDGPDTQHCAGALVMLERAGRSNQMMRIAERLGMYDASKLDMDAPVYRSPAAMIGAHAMVRRAREVKKLKSKRGAIAKPVARSRKRRA